MQVRFTPLILFTLTACSRSPKPPVAAPRVTPNVTAANPAVQPSASALPMDTELTKALAKAQSAPKDAKVQWALVELCAQRDRTDLAEETLRKLIDLEPKSEEAPLTLGRLLLEQKRNSDAIGPLRTAMARAPKLLEPPQLLAGALFGSRRWFEAIDAARKAKSIDPNDLASRSLLASALVRYASQFPAREGHDKELLEARDELMALQKANGDRKEYQLIMATIAMRMKIWPQAIAALEKARNLGEANPALDVRLANCQSALGKTEEAQRSLERAVERMPSNAEAVSALAQLLANQAQSKAKALELHLKAASLEPNRAEYLERAGSALLASGRIQEAKTMLEKAAKANPYRPFPQQQLAVVLTRMGDKPAAATAAKAAKDLAADENQLRQVQLLVSRNPRSVPLNLVLADRYKELGMLAAARDKYLLVLSVEPANSRAKSSLAALTVGGNYGSELKTGPD